MPSTWLERNTEAAFSIDETGDVGSDVHRQLSGPAFYGASWPHPGVSTPESLRGSYHYDLTLGIARGVLQTPGGFHRFEPVDWTGLLPSRAVSSTRQGISLDLCCSTKCGGRSFLPTSACR